MFGTGNTIDNTYLYRYLGQYRMQDGGLLIVICQVLVVCGCFYLVVWLVLALRFAIVKIVLINLFVFREKW